MLRCGIWRAGAVCLSIFVLSTAALADAGAPQHYYFFKEKRLLTLDTSRVALMPRPGISEAPLTADFGSAGLESSPTEALAIAPWRVVKTQAARQSPNENAEAIKILAGQESTEFASPIFFGDDGGPLIVTPDILVAFREDVPVEQAEELIAELGAGTVVDRNWEKMAGTYRVRNASRDGNEVLAAANRLAERAEVVYAEPDMIFTGRAWLIPNDPGFASCWGIHNVGQFGDFPDMDMDGPEAWDTTTGDPSIIVAIIDVGVQQNHPDIHQLTPGFDATGQNGGGGPVNTCDEHGTAVAGCVSATIDNSIGTVGIAPGCRSASARTFISNVPCDGGWSSQASWTVSTLTWAELIGARVSNNSNYYGFQSASIATKYSTTRTNGMVHFASAGNDSSAFITYPASLPTVNAVAALDPNGTLTFFSNFGTGLDFSAPGIDVYSTDRTGAEGYVFGDYAFVLGTSFAAPYTAGVAALVLSVDPTMSAADVEATLASTAVDLGGPGYDTTYGWGFVNAHSAVTSVLVLPPAGPGDDTCDGGSLPGLPCSSTNDCPGGFCGTKNRYLSTQFTTAARAGTPDFMLQVTAVVLPGALSAFNGQIWWAGAPSDQPESSAPTAPTFRAAALECTTTPHARNWAVEGVVHLYGAIVVPNASYELRVCSSPTACAEPPLTIITSLWGDVVSPFGVLFGQPNFADIAAVVDKFRALPGSASKTRTQLQPNLVGVATNVSFLDISASVSAFKGQPYSYPGAACP